MKVIVRNRTIRPSTRKETSVRYRVNVEKVSSDDSLEVNINHENLPFKRTYIFSGKDVGNRNNISFKVPGVGNKVDIQWSGARPLKVKVDE